VTTLLLDLAALGCVKGKLLPNPLVIERFQTLLGRYKPRIIITSIQRVDMPLRVIAGIFDYKYHELIQGTTEYAWIRVPRIEEQEIVSYIIHHKHQAPFVVVGPTGPPARVLGRDVHFCRVTGLFGSGEYLDLEALLMGLADDDPNVP
jgi:hypothetical protein